ncbi:MAG: VWA domain-containing protein, partial [Nannocystaceae bacterium]
MPDAARDAWGITEFAFDTPAWILMALLVAIPLMVRYDRTSLTVRSSACRRLQLAARLALMLSLGATLADPRVRSSRVATDDIVVVDVSDSMTTELRDQVRGYLTAFFKLRAERARGRGIGARLYAPPDTFTAIRVGESVTLDFSEDPAQLTTTPADERGEQSSISLALKTAGSLRRRQGDTRITILSDGRLTPAESARTLAEVQSLTREGVQVRVVPLETSARRNAGITGVTFPEVLRIGQRFESKVLIHASHEGSARLTVEALGEVTSPSPPLSISLQPGDNQVSIVTTASAGGPNAFTFRMQEITLDGGVDTIAEDDTWTEVTNVASRLQVLLISTAQRPAIVGSLERNDLDVTVAEPQAVPSTMEELAKYDLIVLHDVPANRLELSTQRAITSFVDHEGVGLLMIGGPRSYGPGGWQGTPIYDALPVRVVGEKREETPELALMLVIDKSGSMANENKLDLVKRAAQLSARALDPADQIGVIAFDSRPSVLVRLQAASARLRIRSDIRRVGAGGGTNVLPALREAFLQLRGSKAKIKHVIVLSDGQSPEAGVPTLVQQMYDANITVSGVGVGSGAGKTLLRRIAQVGAGRYYFSLDGSDVPSIFQRETRQVSKNMIREEGHVARVRTAAQVLRGLRFDAAPPLVGLTPLAPRPLSEVLLDTTQGEPLLVRGRYGLGRTYAFASDADPRWARAWLSWPGFSRFWSQIARDAARRARRLSHGPRAHERGAPPGGAGDAGAAAG